MKSERFHAKPPPAPGDGFDSNVHKKISLMRGRDTRLPRPEAELGEDTYLEFAAVLAEAERQLQWSIDPDALDRLAQRLLKLDPESRVAGQLMHRARRARMVQRPPLIPDTVVFVEPPELSADGTQTSSEQTPATERDPKAAD